MLRLPALDDHAGRSAGDELTVQLHHAQGVGEGAPRPPPGQMVYVAVEPPGLAAPEQAPSCQRQETAPRNPLSPTKYQTGRLVGAQEPQTPDQAQQLPISLSAVLSGRHAHNRTTSRGRTAAGSRLPRRTSYSGSRIC